MNCFYLQNPFAFAFSRSAAQYCLTRGDYTGHEHPGTHGAALGSAHGQLS